MDEQEKPSVAVSIMTAALTQVTEILQKSEETLQALQSNVATVSSQRTGLIYQRQMLSELINKISKAEKDV